MVDFGKKFLGTKYTYGGTSPKTGFDCSGFVFYVFGNYKLPVPRASMDYEKLGREIPLDSAKKGDVIVFTGTRANSRSAGHVGIVVSDTPAELMFIHSSSSEKQSGVKITNYSKSPGYQKRFIKIVRLSNVAEN